MSLTSGFFDAMEQGEGNYDRVYTAAEFAHYFSLLVGNGVFPSPDTGLNVLASDPASMTVKIGDGSGWINGYFVTVAGGHSVTLEAASGAGTRIDSIIMQWNSNDRKINIIAKSGTASGDPKPVDLQRDAELWELELAQITVGAGVSSVDQTKIKDMRADSDRCGLVTALLKGIDPSTFLKQSEAEFNQWFSTIMNKISSEDVAGSLLKMITEVDNREKEHYTELSGKVNESLDKASMLKPNNDITEYLKVSIGVKYVESVSPVTTLDGSDIQGSIYHAKTQRLFLDTGNSKVGYQLQLRYVNQVTKKWETASAPRISAGSYYQYYHIIATNGNYAVVAYSYSGSHTAYIYKCNVSTNGSITISLVTSVNTDSGLNIMGQPLEGLSQSVTKFMLLDANTKMIIDVTTGALETFTTPTVCENGGDNVERVPYMLSDGSVVTKYASGFLIITPDKREHLFPNRTLAKQGCIDKSGKYIYIPCQSNVLVISRDTYEIVKTIAVSSPSGIFLFEDKLYNSSLQTYLDDSFQKVSPITYLSTVPLKFATHLSNSNLAALSVGLSQVNRSYYLYSGGIVNGLALTHASPIGTYSDNPLMVTENTHTKGIVVLEE